MDNKDLRIGMVVDEGQMTKFENAIRRATIEVSKLADQLNRAAKSFQGFLGGAKLSSGPGGMQFRSGSGFAKTPMSGGISQPVESIAKAIAATAKGSNEALRTMESGLRQSSTKMAGDVHILDNALAKLEKRLGNIKGYSGSGSALPGLAAPANGGFVGQGYKVVNRGGIDTIVREGDKGTMRERIAAFMGFGGGGKTGGTDILSEIRKVVPYAMAAKGAQIIMREMLQQPDDYNRQAVPLAGAFSTRGLSMMYGRDFHSLRAMMAIAQGPQGGLPQAEQRAVDKGTQDATRRWAKMHPGEPMPSWYLHAQQGARKGQMADTNPDAMRLDDFRGASGAVRYGANILNSIIGLDPNILRNLEGVDTAEKLRKNAMIDQQYEIMKAQRDMRAITAFEQGWQGAVGISRGLRTKDPFGLEARLFRRGFNTGDLQAAQSAIAGVGGLGTGLRYRDLGMRSTAAMVDVNSLIGASAQAGVNPGEVAAQVHGMRIDAQAKSVLANALAQQTMAGGPMVGPQGMMAAMAAFGGGGTAGEQMRVANAQISGMGAMNQNLFSGGIDNLQMGRNWVNAIAAAPGNLMGQQFLTSPSMSMGLLARLRQNPNANIPELKAAGLSNQAVLGYGDATLSTMFRNVGISGNNPGAALAREMKAGGFGSDFGGYVKANMGKAGFDPKQAIYTMAQMLKFEGFAQNDQQAYGFASDLAGLGNMGTLRRGGPGDAAAGTAAAIAYDEVGKKKEEDAAAIKRVMTPEYIRKSIGSGQGYAELGEDMGKSAAEVGAAMVRFGRQIDIITGKLVELNKRIKP